MKNNRYINSLPDFFGNATNKRSFVGLLLKV
jgi:hypothetical protein